jgi:hypothetical protein
VAGDDFQQPRISAGDERARSELLDQHTCH